MEPAEVSQTPPLLISGVNVHGGRETADCGSWDGQSSTSRSYPPGQNDTARTPTLKASAAITRRGVVNFTLKVIPQPHYIRSSPTIIVPNHSVKPGNGVVDAESVGLTSERV